MKPGYSLLELTIGIFLASLLAISLFQSVRSTTTTVALADDVMDFDIRVAHFHHQFARDTIGIFVPEKHETPKAKTPEKDINSLKAGDTAKDDKDAEQPKDGRAATQEKPVKFPDKLFYAVNNEEGRVTEFTFITSNPVRVYAKATNVTVKPRMVRVMYRLLADPNQANSFTLFRQETDELDSSAVDPKAAKPIRAYALISNIKKMSFDFLYPVKKEAPKDEVSSSKPPVGTVPDKATVTPSKPSSDQQQPDVEKITTRGDWPFKTTQEAQEKKVPPHPQIIIAKFQLWDTARQSEREFLLSYPIASFTLFEKKKKKLKQPTKQTPLATKGPGAAGSPGGNGLTTKRVELSLTLKPKTEERLAQLGQKVFKLTLEGQAKLPSSSAVEDEEFLARLEQLAKLEKNAS